YRIRRCRRSLRGCRPGDSGGNVTVASVPALASGLKILTPAEQIREGLKVLLYSHPGCGKTRLATSLPWGSDVWGDRAVYVPLDIKERGLRGVLPHNRAHLVTVVPGSDNYDPYTFLNQALDTDWEREAGARTIILDTL